MDTSQHLDGGADRRFAAAGDALAPGDPFKAAAAGANVLVSGTAVFGENELVSTAMDRLRASIKQWQKTASGGQVRRSSTGPPWAR